MPPTPPTAPAPRTPPPNPSAAESIRQQLLAMTNRLGRPERDYVILGEGNTSARIDADTFWVTASGFELGSLGADGFVQVRFDRILPFLSGKELADDEVRRTLIAAKADGRAEPRPSVETFMHAALLTVEGVKFIGHTHPTAVNRFTCSRAFCDGAAGRLFPDEIVLCGPAPVIVPYVDPGLPLARAIHERVRAFIAARGLRPKVVLLQNHGLIALGSSAREVEDITAMAVKGARILAGTFAFGGPNFLPDQVVERIHGRADEHYRQRVIEERRGTVD